MSSFWSPEAEKYCLKDDSYKKLIACRIFGNVRTVPVQKLGVCSSLVAAKLIFLGLEKKKIVL